MGASKWPGQRLHPQNQRAAILHTPSESHQSLIDGASKDLIRTNAALRGGGKPPVDAIIRYTQLSTRAVWPAVMLILPCQCCFY